MEQSGMSGPQLKPMSSQAAQLPGGRWGWFVGLGVLLALLGFGALTYVFAATLASVLFVGSIMIVGGIAQLIQAWKVTGWKGFTWWTLSGVLYLVAGGLVVYDPLMGATILTLLLGASLIAVGVLRLWIWVQNRSQQGWQWLALSAVVSLAAGLLIAINWPADSLWILGLVLAIDLLFQGWMLILLGLNLRSMQRQ